jgi:hypothetical protein
MEYKNIFGGIMLLDKSENQNPKSETNPNVK